MIECITVGEGIAAMLYLIGMGIYVYHDKDLKEMIMMSHNLSDDEVK